jgi:tetratricopeptide (TPR) repeat protein
VLRSLAAAHRRAGQIEWWAETAEVELAALDASPVFDDRRRELRRTLALAYDSELPRPERALRHLRALLDAGEDELLGAEALDRLEEALLRRLREAGACAELEARLSRHLARRPDEAAGWLELARLRDEQLQMPAAAIDAYRRVLEIDPHDLDALRGLRSAAERLGRWTEVAESLERELAHPGEHDPALRGALLRRCGDVAWHRLQSTTRASRCYAAALECDGQDLAALRALQRLLEAMEDWRGALDLYESEIEVLGDRDPDRQHAVWLRVASIARDRKGDVERARRALRRAAQIAPLDPANLAALADLHASVEDDAAFAADFSAWCEHPGTRPDAQDQLRLAAALERLSRPAEALAAVERALALEPERLEAWDAAARLREGTGDLFGAAAALRRAAGLAPDEPARERLLHAASLVEATDPARALALARTATDRTPGHAIAQALRARLARTLGQDEEAETAAERALDVGEADVLPAPQQLEVALIGGDAARARGRLEAAAGFYGRARDVSPDDPRASGGYGETLAALGDPGRARRALEERIARGDRYPERARHHALLARCHEAEGAFEGAVAAAEAALEDDPRQGDAAATLVRAHESLGHLDETIAAMERWAGTATTRLEQAARLLRAADWELRSGEREVEAERHARAAVAADPGLAPAWVLLASLQSADGRFEEAIESADRAAGHTLADRDLRTLALIQANAFEKLGEPSRAAEAFGLAVEADPSCVEAALGRARLLRGAGEWRQAASGLQTFLAQHPDPQEASLADVHEQLARLLAGPLEDVEAGVRHYRSAIHLSPDRPRARAALAELLSHRPDGRAEALAHLRSVLEAEPSDVAGLRVALRIARTNSRGVGAGPGIALLRGLGAASAYELEEQEASLPTPAPVLEDPLLETLRGIAQDAAEPIASALEASGAPDVGEADGAVGRFRAALLRAEGRLSAPALLTLPTREVAEVLTLVVRLTVDPSPSTATGGASTPLPAHCAGATAADCAGASARSTSRRSAAPTSAAGEPRCVRWRRRSPSRRPAARSAPPSPPWSTTYRRRPTSRSGPRPTSARSPPRLRSHAPCCDASCRAGSNGSDRDDEPPLPPPPPDDPPHPGRVCGGPRPPPRDRDDARRRRPLHRHGRAARRGNPPARALPPAGRRLRPRDCRPGGVEPPTPAWGTARPGAPGWVWPSPTRWPGSRPNSRRSPRRRAATPAPEGPQERSTAPRESGRRRAFAGARQAREAAAAIRERLMPREPALPGSISTQASGRARIAVTSCWCSACPPRSAYTCPCTGMPSSARSPQRSSTLWRTNSSAKRRPSGFTTFSSSRTTVFSSEPPRAKPALQSICTSRRKPKVRAAEMSRSNRSASSGASVSSWRRIAGWSNSTA